MVTLKEVKVMCICMTDEEVSSVKQMGRSENEHSPSAAIESMFPGMNVLSKWCTVQL
jgi:hypothetical protein